MKTKATLFAALILLMLASCKQSTTFSPDLFPVKSNDKWGFVDKEGKYIINAQFSKADYFSCGLALVANADGKYGFIDDEGNYIINAQYIAALPFIEDKACVISEGSSPKYINTKGELVFELATAVEAGSFHDGLAKFKDEKGKWGYVDKEGTIKINAQFDDAQDFCNELAAVKTEGKEGAEGIWGYINTSGEYTINPQFNEASYFIGDLACVSNGKQYGYINKKGEYAINPQFDQAGWFLNGMAPVKGDKTWGFIDEKGKYTINPQFSAALCFVSDLAPVSQDGKWGYVNAEGKYIVNSQFENASMFIGKLAIIESSDKYGFIDKEGKYLVNPQFDRIDIDIANIYAILGTGYRIYNETVQSDKVPPLDKIVTQFFEYLNKMDFENAKKISTKKSAESIDAYANFWKSSSDTPKDKVITDVKCKHKGRKAICKYYKDGGEECLTLLKENNDWLVDWAKLTGNCDEYNAMEGADNSTATSSDNAKARAEADSLAAAEKAKAEADSLAAAANGSNEKTKYVTAKAGLLIRSGPGVDMKVLTVVPYNEKVTILSTSNKKDNINQISGYWVKIRYKSYTGYAFDGYLK